MNGADDRGDGRSDPGGAGAASGSDFLLLDTAQAPAGGVTDWLAHRLLDAVTDGRLPVGARLPASRLLAADLGVSRGVVTEAYRRLVEDGWAEGRGRAGTVVVAGPTGLDAPGRPGGAGRVTVPVRGPRSPRGGEPSGGPRSPAGPASVPGAGSAGAPPAAGLRLGGPDPLVFESLRAVPAAIDLLPGVPDLAAFPRAGWLRAERAVLSRLSSAEFGYGDAAGALPMRRAVATWLARNRGVTAAAEEVVIVAGVAQAVALFAQTLRARGVTGVAVEEPGSLGVRHHLRHWGLDTPPVAVDADGLRVDALRATGERAVLLTPAHQFPTGVVLAPGRRRELAEWAEDGGVVIEDDYDAEHRYDRSPVPALRALLPEHVCYAGSVSKWLAPALRIGWLVAPTELREAVLEAKRNADLGNPALPQLVLAELMASGEMERQLRFVRARHRRRRDAMIAALHRHLPGARVQASAAGLHLTVLLPTPAAAGPDGGATAGPDDTAVAEAALRRGVKVQPLSWHRQCPGPPGLVLGYAPRTVTEIADGIAVVGRALREVSSG